MKIYNEDKTQELKLEDLNLELGRLIEINEVIVHEEIPYIQEQGHYEIIAEYPNGGKDVEWIVDVVGQEGKEAYEEPVTYQIYRPYSKEYLHNKEIFLQIEALKRELAAGDYKILKRFEGYYTDEEFEIIKEERKTMRDEINKLENQLYEIIPEEEEERLF